MEIIAATMGMGISEFIWYWTIAGFGLSSVLVWAYSEWKGN